MGQAIKIGGGGRFSMRKGARRKERSTGKQEGDGPGRERGRGGDRGGDARGSKNWWCYKGEKGGCI